MEKPQEPEPTRSFVSIHHSFAETDYGHTLAANVRYSVYKPGSISNEGWRRLLGIDVNNLGHLQLTWNLARSFIRHMDEADPDFFEDGERELIEVAAITHDWAESVVGDINYGDKTAEQEEAEKAQFEENLKHFFTGDEKELEELIRKSLSEVIFTPDTKLGRTFNVIERIGYLRTALRASEHVVNDTAGECEGGFRWLVADVLYRQIPQLVEYAGEFAPVNTYLTNQRQAISEAYDVIDEDVFWNYPKDTRWRIHSDFITGKQAWDDWSANLS